MAEKISNLSLSFIDSLYHDASRSDEGEEDERETVKGEEGIEHYQDEDYYLSGSLQQEPESFFDTFDDDMRALHQIESYMEPMIEELEARYTKIFGYPGVARLDLSSLTQKICGCVIDDNVTTEYPWVYVKKEIIEDNIDLHSESSDFLPVKDEIEKYPGQQILIGYAPSQEHEGQFYVCVTEEGHKIVTEHIENLRQEQQERVRNALFKEPRGWLTLGSDKLIDDTITKKTRSAYEVQVESSVGQLKVPPVLKYRLSNEHRDGYVELTPTREIFQNIEKLLNDCGVKVIQSKNDNQTQTSTTMQVNAYSQCLLDQQPMDEPPKPKKKDLEFFLQSKLDGVTKHVEDNETWDIYANDYAKLVTRDDSLALTITEYKEDQSFYDGKLCKGVISDLSWHPTWTGVVACAYNDISRGDYHSGPPKSNQEQIEGKVLIWSFDDCLKPKLILESHRRVTAVSFCPWNGNILVGGCVNGQVVLWDLTKKIEGIEAMVVPAAAQVHYNNVIENLTTWMKRERTKEVKRPTATSNLKQSPSDFITKIEWIPPHCSIDNRGIVTELPADADPKDYSLQFITSSLDGSIAFWDLKWRPPEEKDDKKKKKIPTVELPEKHKKRVSPYKVLDGQFRPIFMLYLEFADVHRKVMITAMSIRQPILHYHTIDPPASAEHRVINKEGIVSHKYFRVTVEKDPSPFNGIFVGTAFAECGYVTWEGYRFSSGVDFNHEIAKWSWRTSAIHDGPINNAMRARHLRDVVLTTGGHIFAIWREDFDYPIFWRQCVARYTSSCWHSVKPNIILLGRQDGTIELWDLFIKDHEPTINQSISGKIITGIYTHKLSINPQCVAFCDYIGALRIFLIPQNLTEYKKTDIDWMRSFIDREVNRIKEFRTWRDNMIKQQEKIESAKNESEEKQKIEEPTESADNAKKKKGKTYTEHLNDLQQKWINRELLRMQNVILEKKGLKGDVLKLQREPMSQLKKETREKEARMQRTKDQAEEFFEEAVNMNFPMLAGSVLQQKTAQDEPGQSSEQHKEFLQFQTDDRPKYVKEYLKEFKDIDSEVMRKIRDEPFDSKFEWQKLMTEGHRRRKTMDVKLHLNRYSKKIGAEDSEYEEKMSVGKSTTIDSTE